MGGIVSGCLPMLLGLVARPSPARADPLFTLPAPPFSLPLLPSVSGDWTVKLGVQGNLAPTFSGAKDLAFNPSPIVSIQRAGSPDHFRSALDSPSFAIVDTGQFRAGIVGRYDGTQDSSTDKALRGLRKVDQSIEVGGFAEYFPVDWFRTRTEVRNSFGGQKGLVANLSADLIIPFSQRLTFSAGPRFALKGTQALRPYFDVNAAESLATGLPEYAVKGDAFSTGVGGQISYKLTPQWELIGYAEYSRLLGSAANSPLVKFRGSPDQITVGLGVSYAFDVRVR